MSRQRRRRRLDAARDRARQVAFARPTPPARGPASATQDGWLLWLLLPLVVVVVGAAHWPALRAEAVVFDDTQYFAKNPLVLAPSWASAKRFLTEILDPSTVRGYYQPLTMVSLMLDVSAGASPTNLFPFHVTSLVLHAMNTALVVLVLFALFRHAWVAVLAGLLFGLHPMTVEPIPWVGERKTLLAAFFAFFALLGHVQFARSGARSWYAASLATFVLALLSKPTSVPLPGIMLLMDYWPLRRLNLMALREKIPHFVIAAVSAWITFESQRRTARVTLPSGQEPGSLPLVVCHDVVFYLRKILWPTDLTPHYPIPSPISLAHPAILAGLLGTFLVAAVLLLAWRRTPAPLVGALAFFGGLAPTMGVIGFTNVLTSDKYAYLPAVGLLLPLGALLAWAWDSGTRAAQPRRRGVTLVGVSLLACVEFAATRAQEAIWSGTEKLYQHVLRLAPDAALVRNNYGAYLWERDRLDEAIAEFRRAIAQSPRYADAHLNLGLSLDKQRKFAEATNEFAMVVELDPRSSRGHANLGVALKKLGKIDEAVEHYRRAIELDPAYATPRSGLANVLREQGKLDEAIAEYRKAIEVSPREASVHNNLGAALYDLNRLDEAIAEYREALRLEPRQVDASVNLTIALFKQGKSAEAVEVSRRAALVHPGDAGLRCRIGSVLLSGGQYEEASRLYQDALNLEPGNATAAAGLRVALERLGAGAP